jgi:hypothetical protein
MRGLRSRTPRAVLALPRNGMKRRIGLVCHNEDYIRLLFPEKQEKTGEYCRSNPLAQDDAK